MTAKERKFTNKWIAMSRRLETLENAVGYLKLKGVTKARYDYVNGIEVGIDTIHGEFFVRIHESEVARFAQLYERHKAKIEAKYGKEFV